MDAGVSWLCLVPSHSAPLHRAETCLTEEHIHEADGFDRLISKFDIGIAGIAVRDGIAKRHAVGAENPERQGRFTSQDVFLPMRLRGQKTADIVFTSGEVEHRTIPENQPQREEPLTRRSIVVVAFFDTLNAAGCAIAGTGKRHALKSDRTRKPGLPDGAERKRDAGDPEYLR